eukprot:scaffold48225_cov83-Cyclotella_meneghiniana.AAC.2
MSGGDVDATANLIAFAEAYHRPPWPLVLLQHRAYSDGTLPPPASMRPTESFGPSPHLIFGGWRPRIDHIVLSPTIDQITTHH